MAAKTLGNFEAPVAILTGAHASVAQATVIINYTPDHVSNPRVANEAGVPFYNNDVTQVAEAIIRAFPEFNFDPKMLLLIMDQDIRATREALASSEGLHAANLRVERLGSIDDAIAYLEAIRTQA